MKAVLQGDQLKIIDVEGMRVAHGSFFCHQHLFFFCCLAIAVFLLRMVQKPERAMRSPGGFARSVGFRLCDGRVCSCDVCGLRFLGSR